MVTYLRSEVGRYLHQCLLISLKIFYCKILSIDFKNARCIAPFSEMVY